MTVYYIQSTSLGRTTPALGSHENLFFDDFWSLVMEYLVLIDDFWSLVMECLFLIGDFGHWSRNTGSYCFLIGDFWSLVTKLVTSVVNLVINTYGAHPIQVELCTHGGKWKHLYL
jgi:hypothetical protein